MCNNLDKTKRMVGNDQIIATAYVSEQSKELLKDLHEPISALAGGTLQHRGVLEWMIADAYERGPEFWGDFEVQRLPGYKKVNIGQEFHALLNKLMSELNKEREETDAESVAMIHVADYIVQQYHRLYVAGGEKKSNAGQAEVPAV